ncbi:hypothetical protein FWH58_03715, partial [Candidatus Saccharibacteria bacterium]|nr:hypothetical protein [Candidatus Saccharibacteria bacterium]
MFKKLVSNLPFSPSLVAQLGFYARRLKKEQWMRRLGVIFTVFALIIQSFAVFSPPESANAANATDVLSGGCQNKACFLSAWDTNRQGFRDLLTYMEITRDDLNAGTYDLTYASSWSYTFGRTDAYYRVGSITASGTNYYYGPLQWSGRDYALIGYSSKVGAFAILGPCGNLLLNKLPPASGCQSLEASVNSGPAEGVAGQTEYRFRPTGWYQNGGTIGDYYIEWSGPETGKSDWVGMSNWWYHKFGKPGIYKITAYVRGSSGTVTSAACSKTLTIKETPDPKYDLVKEVSAKTIQPGGTLNYTLTFKNLGNVALTNVIIKDALSPYVTLVGRPIVTPATTSSGDLFSIAGLKINSVAVGQTITIKYSVKVKSFEQLVCGQNQIVNQSSVKTDQKTDNGNNDETDPKNNDQTTTVEAVCEFEYDLEKTADKETAQPGDTIKYTLTFRNTGNRELTDVVIKDALPAGVALDGAATVSPADGSSGDLFSSSGLRLAKVAAG